MDQALNELAELLEDLHLFHGVIEDGSTFARVEAMHHQAAQCLARIRFKAAELQGKHDDLYDRYRYTEQPQNEQ